MVCEMGGNRNEFVNRNRQKKAKKIYKKAIRIKNV